MFHGKSSASARCAARAGPNLVRMLDFEKKTMRVRFFVDSRDFRRYNTIMMTHRNTEDNMTTTMTVRENYLDTVRKHSAAYIEALAGLRTDEAVAAIFRLEDVMAAAATESSFADGLGWNVSVEWAETNLETAERLLGTDCTAAVYGVAV